MIRRHGGKRWRRRGSSIFFMLLTEAPSRPPPSPPPTMLSSDVQAAMISGTALVVAGWGGAYVLGNTLANGIEQAAERASKTLAESLKAGSEGLAALGDAAQAYKPAVAALGRSLERGLLLSLFPSSRRWVTAPGLSQPPPLAAAACLGCVLAQHAVPASSGEAILVPLLHSSVSLTLDPLICLPAARRSARTAASA